MRAYFDGKRFLSRQGNRYHAPAWFTAGLPDVPLDGELWLGRKQFQRTVSIVRRHDQTDLWKEVRFMIFDAPALDEPFENRLRVVASMLQKNRPAYATLHEHFACRGLDHLQQELSARRSAGRRRSDAAPAGLEV